jgi:hypothetical protein
MKLINRRTWGARPAKVRVPHLDSTHGVKVHYTGMHVSPGLAADASHHLGCFNLVLGIQDDHMDSNGWNDIGYSFLVCPHGFVFEGRGLNKLPAANGAGLNSGHYAVCGLVGNSGLVDPSDAMLNGIRDAIEYCRAEGSAGNEIKGHRDGYSTDCPGPKLYPWVQSGAPRPGHENSSPGAPWPGRLLKVTVPMMRGADVESVQRWLKVDPDGLYGPNTEKAVRTYQAKHGLAVDGIVGRLTWESLAP